MNNTIRHYSKRRSHKQQGAAILVLMTTLLALAGYVTLELSSANRVRDQKQLEVTRALAFAKDALIGYAVNYVDNYGHNRRGVLGGYLVRHGQDMHLLQ